jgi:hypothetical protein
MPLAMPSAEKRKRDERDEDEVERDELRRSRPRQVTISDFLENIPFVYARMPS